MVRGFCGRTGEGEFLYAWRGVWWSRGAGWWQRSGQQWFDHVAGDVGQAVVSSFMAEGETFMIHAHGVQQGGVQVVDVHGIAHDVIAELIGFSVDHAFLQTAAGHPDGEAAWVVVASEVVGGDVALTVGGAAEFASPDDERFVE